MERLLVTGDIHGEYDQFVQVLDDSNFDSSKDKLILIGDYIDRGSQSRQVVKLVQKLVKNGATALKGNHEDMAYTYVKELEGEKVKNNGIYFLNGGRKTIESYPSNNEFIEDIRWLNKLPVYHIIENKYIFVHAGLKPGKKLSEQKEKDMLWIREEFFYYNWENDEYIEETIIAGHTPVREVQFLPKVIMLDTGAGKGGYLSLLDLTNDKIYTSRNNQ
ncbi:MAG: metallophosphoesterase family protein [Bacillota bacterium]